MKSVNEIYLTKKCISNDEWIKLIHTISIYNGILRKWKIIVTNDKNKLRYFVKTNCNLPTTINNLDSFLFKVSCDINCPKETFPLFFLPKIDNNIIDLINYNKIKNKGNLEYLEIKFFNIFNHKIKAKIKFYLRKNNIIKKYIVIFALPSTILAIDFEKNKQYFYKTCPKYLDISKTIDLFDFHKNNSLLSVDTFPYLQGEFYLNQNSFCFDKHTIVMGASGCGKSKFISSFIYNIYQDENLRNLYRVVVIDPHASLKNDIGGIGKVLDFSTRQNSTYLFANNKNDVVSSTELLLDLFKILIAEQYNSKLERVLRHSVYLLLTYEAFNFENLKKVLLDLEYRNALIKQLKHTLPISIIDFFLTDFNDLKTKSYGEAISPIISFIDEMEMVPIFNSQNKCNNLKEIIDDNFLTLFSLDRTVFGDKVTKTVSGLIMQLLFTIMQKQKINKHIIFIIDEVATIENPILSKYLAESRKYNLSLILAGQYFNQISSQLQKAIFANTINYFIFRVSKLDANVLVDNFNMKIPLDDSRERKIKLLTELNNRECIVRLEANNTLFPAFKGKTLEYKSIPEIIKENSIDISHKQKKDEVNKSHFYFNNNINLRDILISNATSRKVVKK